MEKAFFAKYLLPLLNLVEHACSVGVIGKVKDGGSECGLVKDKRYMPEDGHMVATRLLWAGYTFQGDLK